MKPIKLKLDPQKINIYFYILTAVVTTVVLIFVSFFLYKNFYQAITQSQIILILQEEVAPESVDITKFNEAISRVESKSLSRVLNKINNPFD